MGFSKLIALTGVLTLAALGTAHAADMAAMPEVPQIEPGDATDLEFGTNWYLRGDIGYAWSNLKTEVSYPGAISTREDDAGTWSVGGGVGYDFGWVRTDVTIDYLNEFDVDHPTSGTNCTDGESIGFLCSSTNSSSVSALPILANVYFDLGTWSGFTPYVGAGIGASLVSWSGWRTNEFCDGTVAECATPPGAAVDYSFNSPGEDEWKFTYALMAGVSYALNANLSFDLGYRFTDIDDGRAVRRFNYASSDPDASIGGVDYKDFYNHEIRFGFRYTVD